MNTTNALNAYTNVGIESGVASADPHKLILMLYQGALLAIATAKNQMLRKQIAEKGASITKAIKIIDEGLKACLDLKSGGEIGKNLQELYDYINQRLLIANLKNDITILDEVTGLLNELKGAWESIRTTIPAAAANPAARTEAQAAPVAKQHAAQGQIVPPQTTQAKQAVSMYGRM